VERVWRGCGAERGRVAKENKRVESDLAKEVEFHEKALLTQVWGVRGKKWVGREKRLGRLPLTQLQRPFTAPHHLIHTCSSFASEATAAALA
jgi:hypothetical protein